MFKNKYFTKDKRLNQKVIKNLESMARCQQKIQRLTQKINKCSKLHKQDQDRSGQDDIKTNYSENEVISKDNNKKQTIEWVKEQKEEQLYLWMFLKRVFGSISQEINKKENMPKFDILNITPLIKIKQIKRSEKLLLQILEDHELQITNLNNQQMHPKLKLFHLHNILLEQISKKKKQDVIVYKISKELIYQMLRQLYLDGIDQFQYEQYIQVKQARKRRQQILNLPENIHIHYEKAAKQGKIYELD